MHIFPPEASWSPTPSIPSQLSTRPEEFTRMEHNPAPSPVSISWGIRPAWKPEGCQEPRTPSCGEPECSRKPSHPGQDKDGDELSSAASSSATLFPGSSQRETFWPAPAQPSEPSWRLHHPTHSAFPFETENLQSHPSDRSCQVLLTSQLFLVPAGIRHDLTCPMPF